MKKMTRRLAGGFAAASLSMALVACSEAEDAANEAGDAAGSVAAEATDAAGDAASEATDAAGDAAGDASEAMSSDSEGGAGSSESDGADASEGASESEGDSAGSGENAGDGEMTSISTPNGDVEVPAAFATAIEEQAGEWGDVQDVVNGDNGSLATFAQDKLLAFSNDSGSQPVIGKIAETWQAEGGLDSDLGLPLAPEQVAETGTGWTQEFANGTISWLQNEAGEFEASFS